jgi:hypothetical protein
VNPYDDLGALMSAEVESSERPSKVINVRRAMSKGRRQRWVRRTGVGGLAIAVVVFATAVGVPGLISAARNPGQPPAHVQMGSSGPGQNTTIAEAPATIDPMIRYLRFGWLPDGLARRSYFTSAPSGDSYALLVATSPDDGTPERGVQAWLYPREVAPKAPQSDNGPLTGPVSAPAPSVQGRSASWVSYSRAAIDVPADPTPGEGGRTQRGYHIPAENREFLQWEYAPGGVVRVGVMNMGAESRTLAQRVAEALLIDTEPVALPFQVTGLSPRLRPQSIGISESIGKARSADASLTFTTVAPSADPFDNTLHITIAPTGRTDGDKGFNPPNTTVDGHPAFQHPEALTVYNVDGVDVEIRATGRPILDALSDGCLGVYRHISLIANAATWSATL